MKKEYIYCILSLILLSLGITCCVVTLLPILITISSKSVLSVFGICFILIGLMSYAKYNKNYLKIKDLKTKDIPILAHWKFKSNSSNIINKTLYNQKNSAASTTRLAFLFCLVLACCIYLSKEKYSVPIASFLIVLSLIATACGIVFINHYYTLKLSQASEVLIGEDCFFFLNELHSLQKSIYFLYDVRINFSNENTLQFLYGDLDLFKGSLYTIDIPIPDGELVTAEFIQQHYLQLIHYE